MSHPDKAGAEPPPVDRETLSARVLELHRALESGDGERAESLLDDITRIRESTLFRRMGAITRELHEALVSLQLDPQLATLCEHDIPDAKLRLDYVLEKTEAAAHRTLGAVEEALPVCTSLAGQAARLGDRWDSFRRRELSAEEFRVLSRELDAFLRSVGGDSRLLGEKLSEVLMAQDFQDLTGQVIRRVVELVQEVQGHLVDLIRTRGSEGEPGRRPARGPASDPIKAEGPQVAGVSAANVVQSQDDVDDLLSSLGF